MPLTHVLPALFVFLKWVFDKLGLASFLPSKSSPTDCAAKKCDNGGGSCCDNQQSNNSRGSVPKSARKSPSSNFLEVESMAKWSSLISKSRSADCLIVVKFTASWCGPCKKIAPLFRSLSESHDGYFVTVDVDELEELSEKAEVSMMPTFAIYNPSDGSWVDKVSGANEEKLKGLVKEHLKQIA